MPVFKAVHLVWGNQSESSSPVKNESPSLSSCQLPVTLYQGVGPNEISTLGYQRSGTVQVFRETY